MYEGSSLGTDLSIGVIRGIKCLEELSKCLLLCHLPVQYLGVLPDIVHSEEKTSNFFQEVTYVRNMGVKRVS